MTMNKPRTSPTLLLTFVSETSCSFVADFSKMKLPLDMLINNAGSWPTDHVGTEDGLQETFQV
jgi:hypothetical protein